MPSTNPRSVLRDTLNGISQAAKKGRNESGSLQPADTAELLALIARGDAAIAFIEQIANNQNTVNLVKIVDDARNLSATWAAA